MLTKKAVVIHSGGMDSSLCLALAIERFGRKDVLSLSFDYQQRHGLAELTQAAKICQDWQVDHVVLNIDCLQQITSNALTDHSVTMNKRVPVEGPPNTLVVGRNGLMARLAAIHADSLQANCIYLGVEENENSSYRDCSRTYMDLMQQILQIDLDNAYFTIETPLVAMTKKETLEVALRLGILDYLLTNTITCYRGVAALGCQECPACTLRNRGIAEFLAEHPDFEMPYLFNPI